MIPMIEAPGDVERRVEDCIIKLRHGEIEGLLMRPFELGSLPTD